MKISVVGLGWFGEPLCRELTRLGHQVIGTKRSLASAHPLNHPEKPDSEIMDADCMVLNIPPFENQLEWFQSWVWNPKTWVIFISSTSQAPLLLQEEDWVKTFHEWTIVRFGGLLGDRRHPGKILSGRTGIKGRKWPVNLIHLDDSVGLVSEIIKQKILQQTLNGVCDEHSTKEEFYSAYARAHNLPLPEFDVSDDSVGKLVLNDEVKRFYRFKREKLIEASSN